LSGFVQTKISAEAITEAMNEDGGFAREIWLELAEGLERGMLLDNACDLLSQDIAAAKYIADRFELFVKLIRDRHDELVPDEVPV